MMDTEDAARGESAVIFRGARAAHARTGPALGKGRPRLTDRERRPGDRALVERSRDHHHSISKPIRANRGREVRPSNVFGQSPSGGGQLAHAAEAADIPSWKRRADEIVQDAFPFGVLPRWS